MFFFILQTHPQNIKTHFIHHLTMETNTGILKKKKHEENMDLTYSSAYQYYTVHSVTQHLVLSFLLNKSTLLERLLLKYCVNTK